MPVLVFAAATLIAWGLQLVLLAPDDVRQQGVAADAEATSFLAYHHAVSDWAARHAWVSAAPAGALEFPPGYLLRAEWAHQVVNGRLYTYTRADYRQLPGFADLVRTVGSRACLRARDGSDTAQCAFGTEPLPAAVASSVAPGAVLIVGR